MLFYPYFAGVQILSVVWLPVLKFIDESFGENHRKTIVFIKVNTSVLTKTLSINSRTEVDFLDGWLPWVCGL